MYGLEDLPGQDAHTSHLSQRIATLLHQETFTYGSFKLEHINGNDEAVMAINKVKKYGNTSIPQALAAIFNHRGMNLRLLDYVHPLQDTVLAFAITLVSEMLFCHYFRLLTGLQISYSLDAWKARFKTREKIRFQIKVYQPIYAGYLSSIRAFQKRNPEEFSKTLEDIRMGFAQSYVQAIIHAQHSFPLNIIVQIH